MQQERAHSILIAAMIIEVLLYFRQHFSLLQLYNEHLQSYDRIELDGCFSSIIIKHVSNQPLQFVPTQVVRRVTRTQKSSITHIPPLLIRAAFCGCTVEKSNFLNSSTNTLLNSIKATF